MTKPDTYAEDRRDLLAVWFDGLQMAAFFAIMTVMGASAITLGMVGAWEVDRMLHPEMYPVEIPE